MTDCIFCKIAQKKSPASVVYEDNEVVAFLDISPIAEGHTLVIPKEHFVDIFDANPELLQKIIVTTKNVADAMKARLGVDGVNIINASGRAAEQDVFHFHIHVIPRKEKDQLGFHEWWRRKIRRSNREELDRVAAKLRSD